MDASGVIIAGFHHSGTRLVARMLSALGVYQVIDEPTYEWSQVQRINEVICPSWCDPDALVPWLDQPPGLVDAAMVSTGMREAGYTGGLWGVKDPRLCLTAPAWRRAFPAARLICIYRDPIAVLGTFPASYTYFTPNQEKPSAHLDFWSALYDQYYVAMRRECLRTPNAIELRYEDLVEDPAHSLTRLAQWLNIEDIPAKVALAIKENPIDRKRAFQLKEQLGRGTVTHAGLGVIRKRLEPVRRALGYSAARPWQV